MAKLTIMEKSAVQDVVFLSGGAWALVANCTFYGLAIAGMATLGAIIASGGMGLVVAVPAGYWAYLKVKAYKRQKQQQQQQQQQ